jgi:GT2 family glycosyltransferase
LAKAAYLQHARAELASFFAAGATLRLERPAVAPLVSVILVLHNRAELTLRCLRSLAAAQPFGIEVLIVDNGSTDETRRLLRRVAGAVAHRNGGNLGYPEAVNQAARQARGQYLLLLNNDTELLPGSLVAAVTTLREGRDVGVVVGRIILLDGTLQEAGSLVWNDGSALGYGRGADPSAGEFLFRRDVDFGSAAFLLTERALWEKLAGFDPEFSPAYYEDIDYCFRVRAAGRRIVYEPRATIFHYEFASSGSRSDAIRLQAERRELFRAKHLAALGRQLPPSPENVLRARRSGRGALRVLVFDDRVPRSWLGSGFPRGVDLLRGLVTLGNDVTFYPLSVLQEDWETVYEEIPPEVEVMLGWGVERLMTFLFSRPDYYDRVLICREHNLRRVRPFFQYLGAAKVIYDSEALTARREILRRRAAGETISEEEERRLVDDELALLEGVDDVVAVSESERRAFQAVRTRPVRTLGHALEATPGPENFAQREGLLFLGGILEDNSPNADALEWLVSEIHPRVRQLAGTDVSFTFAGPNMVPRLRALRGAGIRLLGVVHDLPALFGAAKIFVAPTRFAAGLPHKVHQAAAHGLPVVCTSVLANQLGWENEQEILVADDADGFAQQCIRLTRDEELWRRIREGALRRVREECSRASFLHSLAEILRCGNEEDEPAAPPAVQAGGGGGR